MYLYEVINDNIYKIDTRIETNSPYCSLVLVKP